MTEGKFIGLILIAAGLYSSIRFRHNGKTSLKDRKEIGKMITFGKLSTQIKEGETTFAQLIFLIGGILFILIGLAKFFS